MPRARKHPAGSPTEAYVYIIASGDCVKIGVSNNPLRRLEDMFSGMPYPPLIVATRLFPSRERAFAMEKRLHQLFREHRTNGEWFRMSAQHAARALTNVHVDGDRNTDRLVANALSAMINEPMLPV
jgi:predicted GIY-YIG superfamily endonuclease